MNSLEKNLLVIQAHPDDAEAWCAGTLKRLADRGWSITIAAMTGGGMGGMDMNEDRTVEVRMEEAKKAAAVLGADFHCFKRRDGYLFDDEALRIEVVSLIRRVKTTVLMTHLPFDYHQDHRTTAQTVDAAAMLASLPNVPSNEAPLDTTPLFYHTMPMNLTDTLGNPAPEPHFFVDIGGEALNTKMAMLNEHRSQKTLMRHMHNMDDFFETVKVYNKKLGDLVGVDYAECFWQHLGGGFPKNPLLQEELAPHLRYSRKDS